MPLASRVIPLLRGNSDAEFGGETVRRLLELRRNGLYRSRRLFQDSHWRGFRRAAPGSVGRLLRSRLYSDSELCR
jgi:hypothetical protein